MIPTLQKGQVGRYILRKPYSVVLLMQFDDQADGSTTVTDQVGHTTSLYHVPGWTAEIATVSTTSPLMGAGSLVCHPYAETGSFSNIIAKIDSSTDFERLHHNICSQEVVRMGITTLGVHISEWFGISRCIAEQ
jgi:hypothetical protein